MWDKYKNSLTKLNLNDSKIYSVELDGLIFKSTLEFTEEVIQLLTRVLNGKQITWTEYDLLDSYELVGKRRKKDKHCTPCDIKSEYVMFFCKTKLTDYHKGKFGFMCKWCAQKRAEYIGLGNGFISLDYDDIKDDKEINASNYEELAKTMGSILQKKKGGY